MSWWKISNCYGKARYHQLTEWFRLSTLKCDTHTNIWHLTLHTGTYNPPSYSIGRHVFLSGNLSVVSGATIILLTLVTINIIHINSRCWHIQICVMYGCALEKMFSLLALVRVHNLSLPRYKPDSSCVRFSKTLKLQVHPLLNFLTIPDWPNVKFRCSLIGPKVRFFYLNKMMHGPIRIRFRFFNILTPLAFIYVTFFHCRRPCELLHASY